MDLQIARTWLTDRKHIRLTQYKMRRHRKLIQWSKGIGMYSLNALVNIVFALVCMLLASCHINIVLIIMTGLYIS